MFISTWDSSLRRSLHKNWAVYVIKTQLFWNIFFINHAHLVCFMLSATDIFLYFNIRTDFTKRNVSQCSIHMIWRKLNFLSLVQIFILFILISMTVTTTSYILLILDYNISAVILLILLLLIEAILVMPNYILLFFLVCIFMYINLIFIIIKIH
jgi:hypothetical protein